MKQLSSILLAACILVCGPAYAQQDSDPRAGASACVDPADAASVAPASSVPTCVEAGDDAARPAENVEAQVFEPMGPE